MVGRLNRRSNKGSSKPSGILNRTVTPKRRPNAELRTREYLLPEEVGALIEAAKSNRYGHRDGAMILTTFRHGLRAAELVDLRWSQIDFDNARMHVRRVKGGVPQYTPFGVTN
jgi:type 1 fimbriae regulatory protein FimB/type 1 fimbriae regulatory protein FimE